MHGLGQGLGLSNVKLPPGYTPLRCFRIPSLHPTSTSSTTSGNSSGSGSYGSSSSSSSSSSSANHSYSLLFHAKLSVLNVATEGGSSTGAGGSAQGQGQGLGQGAHHNHQPSSSTANAGWGYEWCVVVYPSAAGEGRQSYLTTAEGSCQHIPGMNLHSQNNENDNDNNDGDGGDYRGNSDKNHPRHSSSSSSSSSANKSTTTVPILAPWSWRQIQASLGPLHAGTDHRHTHRLTSQTYPYLCAILVHPLDQ